MSNQNKKATQSRINGALGGRPPQRGESTSVASIRMTPTERRMIELVAMRSGVPWTAWVVRIAVAAAKRSINRTH